MDIEIILFAGYVITGFMAVVGYLLLSFMEDDD